MKQIVIICFFLLGFCTQAQTNIFLGRDFWKTQPTIQQVKDKIAEGNNPTEMNQWSFDATVYAIISHAPTETIKFLTTIEGNEVDKSTHDGRNYLLWAGYAGDYDLVEYLIQKGSDVQWIDDHGFDIVTFTAVGGNTNPKLYDLYKNHGFVLKNSERKGANALLIAAPSAKDISGLEYFIQNGMNWNDVDDNGNNLFLSAASKENIQLLKQIIEKGVDYKAKNLQGENAILIAAQGARRHTNDLNTFIFLNDIGLDPMQENNKGYNVLHYLAMSNPNWDIFDYYLQQGLDVNAVTQDGETPYMLSLKYNNKVKQALYGLTQDFTQQSDKGYTALSYAVSNLDLKSVKAILAKNVKANVYTTDNESLLNILFKNYDEGKDRAFQQIMGILTYNGVKPTVNSKNGNTLFHIAVDKQAPSLVSYAKKLGANIDKPNADGLTPLHLAAMTSTNLDMLKVLKNNGANTRINTEFGEDAVVLALENELLDVSLSDLEFLKATNH